MLDSVEKEIGLAIRDKFNDFLLKNKEKVISTKFNLLYKKGKTLQQISVQKTCLLIDYKIFPKTYYYLSKEDLSKPPYSCEYMTVNSKNYGSNGSIYALVGDEIGWIEINFADLLAWKDIRGV